MPNSVKTLYVSCWIFLSLTRRSTKVSLGTPSEEEGNTGLYSFPASTLNLPACPQWDFMCGEVAGVWTSLSTQAETRRGPVLQ